MKHTESICLNPKQQPLPRRFVPLGRQIRRGFVDGISEDNTPLLRNAFDDSHGDVDPYFSFGNDTIGRDKFERALKFDERKKQLAKEATKSKESAEKSVETAPVSSALESAPLVE